MWVVGTHACMRYMCVFACMVVSEPIRMCVCLCVRGCVRTNVKNACVNMFSYFLIVRTITLSY